MDKILEIKKNKFTDGLYFNILGSIFKTLVIHIVILELNKKFQGWVPGVSNSPYDFKKFSKCVVSSLNKSKVNNI